MKILKGKYWGLIGLVILVGVGVGMKKGWFQGLVGQKRIRVEELSGGYDVSETTAVFNNQELKVLLADEGGLEKQLVLGEESGKKRIEIDLTNQRLYAFVGDQLIYGFDVSTGKWGRTPTGKFEIWTKLRYSKMEGGSKALRTYYYLPNVPYVMYFHSNEIPKYRGYGIHGTYWHDNFGHPMSHGCINMRTSEAKLVYYWAQPKLKDGQSIYASNDNSGTTIIIYGKTPRG